MTQFVINERRTDAKKKLTSVAKWSNARLHEESQAPETKHKYLKLKISELYLN